MLEGIPPSLIPILTAVLTTVLSGGLILAFVAWRKQVKQEPIDEETAAVINARTAGEIALALAKQQESAMAAMRLDQESIRAELTATRNELAAARTELASVRTMWSGVVSWIRDLFQNWDIYRMHDKPPGGLPPGVF